MTLLPFSIDSILKCGASTDVFKFLDEVSFYMSYLLTYMLGYYPCFSIGTYAATTFLWSLVIFEFIIKVSSILSACVCGTFGSTKLLRFILLFVANVTHAAAQKTSQIRLNLVFGVHEYNNSPPCAFVLYLLLLQTLFH